MLMSQLQAVLNLRLQAVQKVNKNRALPNLLIFDDLCRFFGDEFVTHDCISGVFESPSNMFYIQLATAEK